MKVQAEKVLMSPIRREQKFGPGFIVYLVERLQLSKKKIVVPIGHRTDRRKLDWQTCGGILASFVQFDNDVRSERTTAEIIQALRRGQWTFQDKGRRS